MTLISCGHSEGERRCDARCDDADGGHCDCVCGGANHGKGLAQALTNTQQLAEEVLEKNGYTVELNDACLQVDLFLKPSLVLKKRQTAWD